MRIDRETACRLLRESDDIVILTHRKPDGDTLGSGFALYFALQSLGKRVRVECPDPLPEKYRFLYGDYQPAEFPAAFVVAVDVASMGMLAGMAEVYRDRIDLCIDHHHSNEGYAKHSLVEAAPAAAQIIFHIIKGLDVTPDERMANALYTGITTDTGGFRYADVTPETFRIGADLIEYGADFSAINRRMFETKSRGRVAVDRILLESLEYHFGGQCALAVLPGDVKERFSIGEEDLEGISSLPRTIQGVVAGITLFDNADGSFRASLRTFNPVDASAICVQFNGGGHVNAAGCTLYGTLEEAKAEILKAMETQLEEKKLWTASC